MTQENKKFNLVKGQECREIFQSAYENRYTWTENFVGYQGSCEFQNQNHTIQGNFKIDSKYKVSINNIENLAIENKINSQICEFCIHRSYRPFNKVHSQNKFIVEDIDEETVKIVVEGKNDGDKYNVKEDIITYVKRKIHGQIAIITNHSVFRTTDGYLPSSYTSQFFNHSTLSPTSGMSHYSDTFIQLPQNGLYLLRERTINTDSIRESEKSIEHYKFTNLKPLANIE